MKGWGHFVVVEGDICYYFKAMTRRVEEKMNWLATDKWKEQRYIDLKLYSKPEELICITFNPLKMSDKPHWNPQWEEWNCYSTPLRIYFQDYKILLEKYFNKIYPTKDAFDGTPEECFDMCSSNWLGASDWQKILSEVENDFDKMANEEKQFLLSFVKWIREALQYTKIIVVEGNL